MSRPNPFVAPTAKVSRAASYAVERLEERRLLSSNPADWPGAVVRDDGVVVVPKAVAERYRSTDGFFSTTRPTAAPSTGEVAWSDPLASTAEGEELPQVGVGYWAMAEEHNETTGYFAFSAGGSGPACGCGPSSVNIRYTRSGTASKTDDYSGALTDDNVDVPLNTTVYHPFKAKDDDLAEFTESVEVTIDNGSYEVWGREATSWVADNEPTVTIETSQGAAAEGGGDGEVVVSRSAAPDGTYPKPVTVLLRAGGTAAWRADYALIEGGVGLPTDGAQGLRVTIPAGQASVVVTLRIVDDTVVEDEEKAQIRIAAASHYHMGFPATANVFIADNDPPPPPPGPNDPPPPPPARTETATRRTLKTATASQGRSLPLTTTTRIPTGLLTSPTSTSARTRTARG